METKTKTHSHIDLLYLAGIISLATILRIWKYHLDKPINESLFAYWASSAISLAIIFIVYLISLKLTENNLAALFSAALAATIPLYSWRTVAQLTHSLAVFLFFLSVLSLLYMKEMGDWKYALIVPLILAFVHVYALLLIPIFGIYMLLVKLERKDLSMNEIYFAIVSSVAIAGIFFFFTATPAFFLVIEQYIKANYYAFAVENFNITSVFAIAGLVPTYLGMFGLYLGMHERKKSTLLMLSAVISILLVLLFNLIPAKLGLPYFSLTLATLAGFFWKTCDKTMLGTKLKRFRIPLTMLGFLIILAAGVVHFIS